MYLQRPSTLQNAIELAKRANAAIALSEYVASRPNNKVIPMELGMVITNVHTKPVHKVFSRSLRGQAHGRGNGCAVRYSTAPVVCYNCCATGHFVM